MDASEPQPASLEQFEPARWSFAPLFTGGTPAGWWRELYYRYYHDPGHHDTRAHYGIRTDRHKLIHYWKQDQWELYDLAKDPDELKNLHGSPAAQPLVADLKARLKRLQQELGDTGQFTGPLPKDDVDDRPRQMDRKHPDSQL